MTEPLSPAVFPVPTLEELFLSWFWNEAEPDDYESFQGAQGTLFLGSPSTANPDNHIACLDILADGSAILQIHGTDGEMLAMWTIQKDAL